MATKTADVAARRPPADRAESILRAVVFVAAMIFVLMFVVIAFLRLRYPFELEWMEGGTLDAVRRAASGHSLYARPSLQFTAYLYTPLYYYVSAAVGAVLGTTIVTLRFVSLVAALTTTGLIGALVYRETDDSWAAAVAAGLFLACYRISGAWLDIARVDSLFLALMFGGVFLARVCRRSSSMMVAGVVMAAAVETKQQAVIVGIAVAAALFVEDRRRARAYCVGLVGALAGATVLLEVTSGGWFHRYAVELLLRHHVIGSELVRFWSDDLWRPLAVAVTLCIAALLARGETRTHTRTFYTCVTIGCVIAAYSSRLHSGGYDNVLIPVYAAIALVFGLALHRFARSGAPVSRVVAWIVLCGAIVQFAVLAYDPFAQIPTATDVEQGHALLAELRSLPGPVAAFGHGWYLERVAHVGVAQCAAVEDVLRAHLGNMSADLAAARTRALRHHEFRAVVVDSRRSLSCLPPTLCRYYRPAYRLRGPWPLTGTRTRPMTVWVPRAADDRPATGCAERPTATARLARQNR